MLPISLLPAAGLLLAFGVSCVIAAVYVAGALEMRRFFGSTIKLFLENIDLVLQPQFYGIFFYSNGLLGEGNANIEILIEAVEH